MGGWISFFVGFRGWVGGVNALEGGRGGMLGFLGSCGAHILDMRFVEEAQQLFVGIGYGMGLLVSTLDTVPLSAPFMLALLTNDLRRFISLESTTQVFSGL